MSGGGFVAGAVACPVCGLDLSGLAHYLTRTPRATSREVCGDCGALLFFTFLPGVRVRLLTTQEAAALAIRNPVAWYLMAQQSAEVRHHNGLDPTGPPGLD